MNLSGRQDDKAACGARAVAAVAMRSETAAARPDPRRRLRPAAPRGLDRQRHALRARGSIERHCTEIPSPAERALGMAAQDGAGEADRLRRDLSLFLRQAAPDAKLDRAVAVSCDAPDPEEFEAW